MEQVLIAYGVLNSSKPGHYLSSFLYISYIFINPGTIGVHSTLGSGVLSFTGPEFVVATKDTTPLA